MNSLPRVSLDDTLTLLQLVRETALAQGRDAQAKQLAPAMEQMQEIVAASRKSQAPVSPSSSVMGQADFRTMLEISKGQAQTGAPREVSSASSAMERNRLIQAMASADMSDVDIARQFGMTREEVRLVLSTNQKGKLSREVTG